MIFLVAAENTVERYMPLMPRVLAVLENMVAQRFGLRITKVQKIQLMKQGTQLKFTVE